MAQVQVQVQSTVTTATTLSLDNPKGRHAIRAGWIYVGMWLDIGTKATPAPGATSGVKVTDVDDVANTITIDTPVTLAAGDIAGGGNGVWIGRYGNRGPGVAYEMTGLEGVISTCCRWAGSTRRSRATSTGRRSSRPTPGRRARSRSTCCSRSSRGCARPAASRRC